MLIHRESSTACKLLLKIIDVIYFIQFFGKIYIKCELYVFDKVNIPVQFTPYQDIDYFYHPESSLMFLPHQFWARGNQLRFFQQILVLPFLEFQTSRIIQCAFFA